MTHMEHKVRHNIEYADLLGFGYKVGCRCGWYAQDTYKFFHIAEMAGELHVRIMTMSEAEITEEDKEMY